jgi:molybdenum cofactor biosynthesis enzyme
MALTLTEALIALQQTNAELVESVNVSKGNIEAEIAAAVVVSENAALIPLANATTNSITTQTLLINVLNNLLTS